MAEVVAPGHGGHTSNVDPMAIPGGPRIEMIQNPDFSFPMQPASATPRRRHGANDAARPASMHSNIPPPQSGLAAHRRAVSTLLPSFTFNASDASGLLETPTTTTPPKTPEEEAPFTPSRRGHRRGGSEFVGGDSRLGVSSVVSSSPTKTNALPLPIPPPGPPAGRRGHSHRRSAAISNHDLSEIMRPADAQPRMSTSLPTTPMEFPGQSPPLDRATSAPEVHQDPFGPPLDEQSTRPPSRPRVGFSDNVEIIPRPLSTISSETESSMSTIRGHSVNNSISSVLSLGTPSPPSSRPSRASVSAPLEDDPKPKAKSSIEISRRVEKEGEWLKSRSSQSLKRPLSESAAAPSKTTFVEPEAPVRRRTVHKKKQSMSHTLGFDRRKSEPAIGMAGPEQSRNSAISLGSVSSLSEGPAFPLESNSSTKRLKAWASAKLAKKPKESNRAVSESSSRSSMRPESAGSSFVAGKVAASSPAPVETDLDAVLGTETPKAEAQHPASQSQPRIEVSNASLTFQSGSHSRQDEEDDSMMLDLDAALGPFKTPPIGGGQRQRKELHSSRLNKDFTGPGGHYHRRAESAPALPPFEAVRVGTPSQQSMADVFEEEEEEEQEDEEAVAAQRTKPASTKSASEDESGIGISIVDMANSGAGEPWNLGSEDGLGIQRGEWEPERPTTSYSNAVSRLSTSGTDRRGSSIIEETIFEEVSPVEAAPAPIEIVDAEEEPRASSLTKSSDSSETPTLLGTTANLLPVVDGQRSMTTPDTYQTSTFSSPDLNRRQASFEASRLGTAASSIADTRTTSSCTTAEQGSEVRMSVDDVPSLTSSRSTMMSTAQANNSQRNVNDARAPSANVTSDKAAVATERRRNRSSIASFSQLLSSRSKELDDVRPKTAAGALAASTPAKKKEHRLKKLMFWKSKNSTKNLTGSES